MRDLKVLEDRLNAKADAELNQELDELFSWLASYWNTANSPRYFRDEFFGDLLGELRADIFRFSSPVRRRRFIEEYLARVDNYDASLQ